MSNWKPVAYMPLHVQHAPAVQAGLFAYQAEPREEPACLHPSTQPQLRFDGSVDQLCNVCGKVVA